MLKSFEKEFNKRPENQVMMNAVTRGSLQNIALNRKRINELSFTFSHEVEAVGPITDQMNAGTCWLFAQLNWFRWFAAKKMKVESFEFSENQVIFWNKLERSNYFLEKVIELRDKPWDDRRLLSLLENPVPDGGDCHMLADIIDRYGLMPKDAMPDTFNREKSRFLNMMLNHKLRQGASTLRKIHADGMSVEELRKKKLEIMKEVYRINAVMLGEPPKKFDFVYRDKDKKTHVERGMTPKQFYKKYVGIPTKDIYSVLSSPLPETPYNRTFTAEFMSNTYEGRDSFFLNVPKEEVKKLAIKVLKSNEPCLFVADVVQSSHSKEGILDSRLYDYDLIFDTSFDMDEVEKLHMQQSCLTHLMVFLGVDLDDEDKPIKWKVENSWGEAVGKKGIFVMSDEWFDDNVYGVIVKKKYLTEKMLELFDQKPIQLPSWHPMA